MKMPGKGMSAALGALGTAGFFDNVMNHGDYSRESMTRERGMNALFNAVMGAGGGMSLQKGKTDDALKFIAGVPVKDLAMNAIYPASQHVKLTKDRMELDEKNSNGMRRVLAGLGVGAGVLGAGGLALGARQLAEDKRQREEEELANRNGRVRLTLPTKDPNDVETQIELPFAQTSLSNKMRGQLDRDIRRKIRSEGKERTRHRIKKASFDAQLDDCFEKLAGGKDISGLKVKIQRLAASKKKDSQSDQLSVTSQDDMEASDENVPSGDWLGSAKELFKPETELTKKDV